MEPKPGIRRDSDLALPEGLEAGLVGGLAVVLVYLVPDWMSGDWLRTPALLGSLLLMASTQEAALPQGGLAGIYSLVHFGAWAIAGFGASAVLRAAEGRDDLRHLPAVAFMAWITSAVMLDLWLAQEGLPVARLWAGTLIGALAFAAYLMWRHPSAGTR
jgi:hypothetical protein